MSCPCRFGTFLGSAFSYMRRCNSVQSLAQAEQRRKSMRRQPNVQFCVSHSIDSAIAACSLSCRNFATKSMIFSFAPCSDVHVLMLSVSASIPRLADTGPRALFDQFKTPARSAYFICKTVMRKPGSQYSALCTVDGCQV